MARTVRPQRPGVTQPRGSIRFTFRVANGEVQLLSSQRLDMVSPPSIGDPPQAAKHGGFWMELRDANDRILFHRILHAPLGDSVEVHSPDRKIRREFGAPRENVFEVLVPDDPRARSIALMGESLDPAHIRRERAAGARELARFDVPK